MKGLRDDDDDNEEGEVEEEVEVEEVEEEEEERVCLPQVSISPFTSHSLSAVKSDV